MSAHVVREMNSEDKTRGSKQAYEQAKSVIPGGVTANIKHFAPHPIIMDQATGSQLTDVDGNNYIDYLLCYGALILGHGHEAVKDAVYKQMEQCGSFVFGAPHNLEYQMAKKLVDLFPGMDQIRFTNSGLEATLLSIRLAQAYNGKHKVAKFEGHYHGGYDQMLVSVNPDMEQAGEVNQPNAVAESSGMSDYHLEHTVVLPFNDLEATEEILKARQDEISAVILEPVQGGFIPADESFMKGLREVTEELGIVLIFDEVKTGFRLNVGGAQSLYGVEPDLTALGKVLGGGFPVGALGGKIELMDLMSPERGQDILTSGGNQQVTDRALFHSGTYNGHPTVLAAGLATIDELEKPGVMEDLLKKTEYLRNELENLYNRYSIPMQTIGMGSIFNIVFTNETIKNYRDLSQADMELRKQLDYELLDLGVYTKPGNRYSMSTVHSDEDIQATIDAHEQAIQRLR
ncbi:aspartate aminotransferase family protein [Alkalibacillus haloalkaliphilus]|uniref:aspartate aminotransferase family protein n=1 Tax=Alkalibacillus haloalkaliphilus TaxID=94136 RepID=UPI002935C76D|nr:aspartate aminotransferase family protein [Alkalibacillus haloalkaliphilus]MDV2581360.1 aspartate aminotransferase family protein [Alkalibacillus haloalkaliphilus]